MKFNLRNVQKSRNDEKRGLTLPPESSVELAELLGILTGDGYMNHYPSQGKYLIEIAGDSRLDNGYFDEVSSMIHALFGIKPTLRFLKGQNTMNLRMISKGMFNFLLQCGFKRGRKEQIGIPLWIKEDEKCMNAFIRGLADTDFSFHWRKDYPIISGGLKSEVLMVAVAEYLRSKGFAVAGPYKETTKDLRGYRDSVKYRMALNGHKNLERWMRSIGFRNKRHLRKIDGDGEI